MGSKIEISLYFGVCKRHQFGGGYVFHYHKIGDGEIEGVSDSEDVVLGIESADILSPVIHYSTSKAVVGEKMFLVGGAAGYYPNETLDDKVHWCDDIAKGNWQINRLNMARDRCQLVAMDKLLYAFGSFTIYNYEFGDIYNFSPDHPWAECYNLEDEDEIWTPIFGITPIDRKSLPWRVFWCLSNSPDIVFLYGFDAEDDGAGVYAFKLYRCDLVAKTCAIHDAKFTQNFRDVAMKYHGSYADSLSETRILALQNKPAHHGDDYLCFALRDHIYCYDLKATSWCAKPMAGLERAGILPRCDRFQYDPVDHFQILGLGKDTFCLIWTDAIDKLLHCTNFEVSLASDGTLTASRLSTTKKLKLLYSFHRVEAYSFAIQHKEKRKSTKRPRS